MMNDLNENQQAVLDLMRKRPDRDLYEGSAPPNGKRGSGEFWLTYSADETYCPLGWQDVHKMVKLGLLVERWPGCFMLPGATREPLKRAGKRKQEPL